MSDEPRSLLSRALRLAWPVALVVLGAMVLATAWHRWTISLLFAAVAAVPLLLLRGGLRVGLSRWATTALLVLLTVMCAYLATAGAELTLQETVRDVVPRLLTSSQPYAVQPDLVVGPLLLTAFVSLLVGLRTDSRTRIEPVVGSAVLYVAGALLTDGAADPWGLVAVLILVVALLGWVFLDEHSEPVRTRLSIAAPVSVIGVGALAALATLPLTQPFSPRTLVDPPRYDVVATNPLSRLGAWANNPSVELLQVRGDKVPLRLVVLDRYDGTQWTSATSYARLGTGGTADLSAGLDAGGYRTDATVQVQFERLGGSWLPSPGAPAVVGATDALVDPESGTLFSPDDTAGLTYEISGGYDDPPADLLEGATLPDDDALEQYTELPPLSPELSEYATRVAAGTVTPYERASAIEQQLRDTYRLSPKAISGSALWRIDQFLLGDEDLPGGRIGTSEQFATAFALLARYNGLPTRVVVGFRPGDDQPDGTRIIHAGDALAWAEVYFRDLGWVPFSPTPDDDTFSRPRPVKAVTPDLPEVADTGVPSLDPSPTTTAPVTDDVTDDAPAAPAGGGSSFDTWPPAVLGGIALAVVVLGLVLARALRRLRHRRQGAVGAWAEILDALRLSGRRPARHQPADVVAAWADESLGTTEATAVATRAQWAAFGPDQVDATGLREQVRTVRSRARRAVPLWRRWWWHLDPRVLGR